MTQPARIPLYRTLTFRVAFLVFLALIVIDLAMVPIWVRLADELMPEWSDPEFLRSYIEVLEGPAHLYEARIDEFEDLRDPIDRAIAFVVILALTALIAPLLAVAISRLATQPIRSLASQASRRGDGSDSIPGPFEVGGSAEVRQLAGTLNDMRSRIAGLVTRLRERDRLRTEWVSGVSHDLRVPLTALSVSLGRSGEILERMPPSSERDDVLKMHSAAQLDVQRVVDLAEDLLEMARLEIGSELVLEPVPPGELLRSVALTLEPLARSRGLELQVEFPPGLAELQADGRRLTRALENLVANSLRHAESRVQLLGRSTPKTLEIDVIDDGPGLPSVNGQVDLQQLGPDRRRADSNGLGLEVARRIIEAHGGHLGAKNLQPTGAMVRIDLPI